MSEEFARAHVFLSGKVQGVGMRAQVQSVAYSLALKGFVRNLHDGRVECVMEGPRFAIENALMKLQEGIYSGFVKNVDINWEKPKHEFRRFEVTY